MSFTCISSEANSPVYNYLLSGDEGDEDGVSFSKSGSSIKRISRGEKSSFNCLAYHLLGNVTSRNNITLTVNVKRVNSDEWHFNKICFTFTFYSVCHASRQTGPFKLKG